jgi:hypothetical protein
VLIALTEPPDGAPGKRALIVGLMARNVQLLLNDQPIRRDLAEYLAGHEDLLNLRLRDVVLYVLGPEDTFRLEAHAHGAGEGPPPTA